MIQAWMRGVLLIASVYNMAWGVFLIWSPDSYIKWMTEGAQSENQWVFYQAIGILVVAVMLFMGFLKPLKFKWPILLSFLAKLFGGLVVYLIVMDSQFTKKFMFHLLMNDLVWLVPLLLIVIAAFKTEKSR
ncbi:hypothetical protein SAMN05661096_00756 [Marivirga sericea]|uniref:DoxX-like family protein n=1 Tax=Marivirga sericea TaxID=1028 RepID=A0A1X7ILB4_9BACT|nr:hypothetical protein [Marivirga sericea]SMG15373.1 hypothetical protein SAMN05661096_00756 [Marivirga sericea]